MKKYLFPVTVSLVIGVFMAYFIIRQYEDMPSLAVSKEAEILFYIQRGVYSDMESMYYAFIGITVSKDNALKIQNYYKEIGYDTFLKEKITDNSEFINVLSQYDELLRQTDSAEAIGTICNQVLAKYEELVK